MQLTGNKLVLPLFDAQLSKHDSYYISDGVSVFNLPNSYEKKLRSQPELIAGYESSLKYMKSGLAIEPGKIESCSGLDMQKLREIGTFVAMSIRLATGAPIDIPYWFDIDGDEIKGYGNTLLKTYRIDNNRKMYSLDDELWSGLSALQKGFADILKEYIHKSNRNVLIRALEFAAIGFQTRYIPPRLVNNTIFLESLFSYSNVEIAFQIASSVSWYLESENAPEKRIDLFSKIKKLYNYRSKIVHGSDISSKNKNLLNSLLFSEKLNTKIYQRILLNKHIEIFSMKQDKRQKELRNLSLGANSKLIRTMHNPANSADSQTRG